MVAAKTGGALLSRRAMLRALLTIGVVVPLADACGGSPPLPAQTAHKGTATAASVKLVFLSRGSVQYQQVFKESIANFQRAYPTITIENEPVVGNFDQKLETMLAGNVAPDVFFGMAATFLVYPAKGETVDLDGYAARATDFKASAYYPYWLKTMRWKGKLVALPYDPDMVVLYYNKALFDKAHLSYPNSTTPLTWAQLRDLAEQLTVDVKGNRGPAADQSHMAQYGLDPMYARMWWQLPREYGVHVFNADLAKTNLDQAPAIDALQVLVDLGQKYRVTTTPQSGTSGTANLFTFPTGRLAMVIDGGWSRGYYSEAVKDPWDIAPLPQVKGKPRVGMGWASGLMISKQSKHPEQGWQFIAYLAGKKAQSLLLKEGVSQPMMPSMANDPSFTAAPEPAHKTVLLNEVAYGDPPPYIPAYLEIQTVIQNDFLDVALVGKQNVQTALATVVPKINAILKTYKKQFGE